VKFLKLVGVGDEDCENFSVITVTAQYKRSLPMHYKGITGKK